MAFWRPFQEQRFKCTRMSKNNFEHVWLLKTRK